MPPKRPAKKVLALMVARLTAYPAVFLPTEMGGYDVIFPNFTRLATFGRSLKHAKKAAARELTAELALMLRQGDEPPRASEPGRLVPDPQEPPGSQLLMVEPDRDLIAQRLGLKKASKAEVLKTWGRLGR